MMILLMGAPGSGKGTQADILVEKYGYRKISTGDALRKHIADKTDVGKVAEEVMAKGQLVSDDILLELIKTELGDKQEEKIILDGYPRNLRQAEDLASLEVNQPLKSVVHIDVPNEELIERLTGRRICQQCGRSYHLAFMPPKIADTCDVCGGQLIQRPDDTEEKVKTRLQVYRESTEPVLDYYKKRGLYCRVNGSGPKDVVFQRVKKCLENIDEGISK